MPDIDNDPIGTLTLEGKVIGPDGDSVEGAEVLLDTQPRRSAHSDKDGVFRFDGLGGRTYMLSARTSRWISNEHAHRLTRDGAPVVIRLEEGTALRVIVLDTHNHPISRAEVRSVPDGVVNDTDDTGQTILRPLRPGILSVEVSAPNFAIGRMLTATALGRVDDVSVVLDQGTTVVGRVVDEDDAGIPRVRVSATDEGSSERSTRAVMTDDDGRFEIGPIASGPHWLAAVRHPYAPRRKLVNVGSTEPEVTIRMRTGRALAGTVVSEDGRPASAVIRVLATSAVQGTVHRYSVSGVDGRFELRGLSPGVYRAQADSYDSISEDVILDLTDTDQHEARLVLQRTGEIFGIVTSESGVRIPGVAVRTYSGMTPGIIFTSYTDEKGAFRISGLHQGGHVVETIASQAAVAKTGERSLHLVHLELGAIKGKLQISDTLQAPRSFDVKLSTFSVAGREDGSFELIDVPPGSYTLWFNGPDFASFKRENIRVESRQTTDLGTLRVDSGRSVSGSVVDSSGQRVAGARVTFGLAGFAALGSRLDPRGGWVHVGTTNERGQFSLDGIPADTTNMTLSAEHPMLGRSSPITVAGGDAVQNMTLTLKACGSVKGRVTHNGAAVVGALVSIGVPELTSIHTDDSGVFLFVGVPEGRINVYTSLPSRPSMPWWLGERRHTTLVTIRSNVQSDVDVAIVTGNITLHVRAPQSTGADHVKAYLFSGTVAFATRTQLDAYASPIDAAGFGVFTSQTPEIKFEALLPGDYTLCTMSRQPESLRCRPVHIAAAPREQQLVLDSF